MTGSIEVSQASSINPLAAKLIKVTCTVPGPIALSCNRRSANETVVDSVRIVACGKALLFPSTSRLKRRHRRDRSPKCECFQDAGWRAIDISQAQVSTRKNRAMEVAKSR